MGKTRNVNTNESSAGRRPQSAAKRKGARRKYGRKASEKVEGAVHEMKRGKLRSGRSKKKVKSRKQAIAIGLNEARRSGGKVPKAPKRKKGGAKRKKGGAKRKKGAPKRKTGGSKRKSASKRR